MNEGETVADAAVPQNKAMTEVADVPRLPRVLIIGDSISIAYTLPVRELLKGKANVHRISVNAGASNGPKRVQTWLGHDKWDVVIFNFGIHDAKIKKGQVTTELAAYEQNLREVVGILQENGARLIFATTTPIPAVVKPEGRTFAPIPPYNEVALKVMKESNVSVEDLYALMTPVQEKYQKPFDVHFTKEGSEFLAKDIALHIEQQLQTSPATSQR